MYLLSEIVLFGDSNLYSGCNVNRKSLKIKKPAGNLPAKIVKKSKQIQL